MSRPKNHFSIIAFNINSVIKLLILVNTILFLLILSCVLYYRHQSLTQNIHPELVDASRIMRECENIPGSKEQCYAEKFYKLTASNPIEYSISVLKELQKIDSQSRGCHLISHSISGAETEKNPYEWKKLFSKVSARLCTGGFIHGIVEEASVKIPDLVIDASTIPEICKLILNKSGDTAEFNCAHIFGHILLADRQGSITLANNVCNELPDKLQYECYSGVYMENMTRDNLVSHGVAVKIPWNKETTLAQQQLCVDASLKGFLSDAQVNSCWRELVHMYAFISNSYPPDVYELCQSAPTPQSKEDCYFHGLGIITASHQFDEKYMGDLCKPYLNDPELIQKCVGWAIGSMLNSSTEYIDRISILCMSIPKENVNRCFQSVGARLQYIVKDESSRNDICNRVPTEYRSVCVKPNK